MPCAAPWWACAACCAINMCCVCHIGPMMVVVGCEQALHAVAPHAFHWVRPRHVLHTIHRTSQATGYDFPPPGSAKHLRPPQLALGPYHAQLALVQHTCAPGHPLQTRNLLCPASTLALTDPLCAGARAHDACAAPHALVWLCPDTPLSKGSTAMPALRACHTLCCTAHNKYTCSPALLCVCVRVCVCAG